MATIVTPLQTFAQMLATLRVRCGLNATLGATPALNDILTEANEYVFQQLDDGYPDTSTIALLASDYEYPWVNSDSVPIARGSVQSVWIEQGSSDRVPLLQGITQAHLAYAETSIPQRYDSKFIDDVWSLMVWPTPDQAYTLYIEHNRVLARFSEVGDYPSSDYRLVLGYAIALGKAHYGKPDADTVGQSFKTMLNKAKIAQREERRYLPPTSYEQNTGPYIVSTPGGFRQVW